MSDKSFDGLLGCTCDACHTLRKAAYARQEARIAESALLTEDMIGTERLKAMKMDEVQRRGSEAAMVARNETMKQNMGKVSPATGNGNVSIDELLDELNAHSGKLDDLLRGLEDRLAPVLGPHPPQADNPLNDVSDRSALAQRVLGMIQDVDRKIDMVEQINYRLEL